MDLAGSQSPKQLRKMRSIDCVALALALQLGVSSAFVQRSAAGRLRGLGVFSVDDALDDDAKRRRTEEELTRRRAEEFSAALSGERQFDSTYDLTVLYDRVASARDAAACEKRATAQRWRTGAYSRFTSIELEDATVVHVKLSGATCAFGTNKGFVVVVDLLDGVVLDGFDAHASDVTALAWDGSTLVSGACDGSLRLFDDCGKVSADLFDEDLEEDEALIVAGAASAAAEEWGCVAVIDDLEETDGNFCDAPQSRWEGIIVDDDEGADAEEEEDDESDGIELRYHTARVTGVQLLADGDLLSSSLDASIVEWNAVTRAPRLVATAHSAICCLAVDDGIAVVGLLDGSVVGFDVTSGEVTFEFGSVHEGAVRSLHFDTYQSNRRLVTGGADGAVKVHDLRATVKPRALPVPAAAAAAANDNTRRRIAEPIALKRAAEQRVLYFPHHEQVFLGHSATVVAVQVDDEKIVSASTDGSLRVWDLKTGDELYTISGYSNKIASLHFENDLLVSDGTMGSLIVSAFSDPQHDEDY